MEDRDRISVVGGRTRDVLDAALCTQLVEMVAAEVVLCDAAEAWLDAANAVPRQVRPELRDAARAAFAEAARRLMAAVIELRRTRDAGCHAGVERSCISCGCTEIHACPDGCAWVAPDLCSRCAEASAVAPDGSGPEPVRPRAEATHCPASWED